MAKKKKMGAPLLFTEKQVLKAILNSNGTISGLKRKLKVKSWSTAKSYIDRWESTKLAFEDHRQSFIDIAESTVQDAIEDGDVGTAKWYLSRVARLKYGDNLDVTGEQTITIAVNLPIGSNKELLDEL